MWPHARNLKIPFLRSVSKRHTGLPVYGTVHAHKLCIKKERKKKKKKRHVNITQANSPKIQISSLCACAGFFCSISAEFSLLKYPSSTPGDFGPPHFFKFSLVNLWRGSGRWFSYHDPILLHYLQPPITRINCQNTLAHQTRDKKNNLSFPSIN